MKLQTISRAQQARLGRELDKIAVGRRLLAASTNAKNTEKWQRPEELMKAARRSCYYGMVRNGIPIKPEILDDLVQEVMLFFYSLPLSERPSNRIWFRRLARKIAWFEICKIKKWAFRTWGADSLLKSTRGNDEYGDEADDAWIFSTPCTQEMVIHANQILEMAGKLPSEEQKMFWFMAEGADLFECMRELKLKMFPAHELQQRVRECLRHHAETAFSSGFAAALGDCSARRQ